MHTYTFKNHLAQFSPDRLAVVKHMVVMIAVLRHVEECLDGSEMTVELSKCRHTLVVLISKTEKQEIW